MNLHFACQRRIGAAFALPLLALFLFAGCGGSVGQVEGTVTLKQKPISSGEVMFQSEEDPKAQFFGIVGGEGVYQVSYRDKRGMPPGRYSVTITRHVLPGGKELPGGEEGAVLMESGRVLKEMYVFEKDVKSGTNPIEFELTEATKKTSRKED